MSCCRRRLRDSILPLILDHPSSTALISQQFVIPTCLYGTQVRTSSDPSSPHLALSSAVELMDGFSSHPCLTTAAETGSGRGGVKPRASQCPSGPGQATVFLTAAGDPGAMAIEAREETKRSLQLHEEGRKGQTQRGKRKKNPTLHPEVFQDFRKRITWCDVFCARDNVVCSSPSVFYHACTPQNHRDEKQVYKIHRCT